MPTIRRPIILCPVSVSTPAAEDRGHRRRGTGLSAAIEVPGNRATRMRCVRAGTGSHVDRPMTGRGRHDDALRASSSQQRQSENPELARPALDAPTASKSPPPSDERRIEMGCLVTSALRHPQRAEPCHPLAGELMRVSGPRRYRRRSSAAVNLLLGGRAPTRRARNRCWNQRLSRGQLASTSQALQRLDQIKPCLIHLRRLFVFVLATNDRASASR